MGVFVLRTLYEFSHWVPLTTLSTLYYYYLSLIDEKVRILGLNTLALVTQWWMGKCSKPLCILYVILTWLRGNTLKSVFLFFGVFFVGGRGLQGRLPGLGEGSTEQRGLRSYYVQQQQEMVGSIRTTEELTVALTCKRKSQARPNQTLLGRN